MVVGFFAGVRLTFEQVIHSFQASNILSDKILKIFSFEFRNHHLYRLFVLVCAPTLLYLYQDIIEMRQCPSTDDVVIYNVVFSRWCGI